MLQSIVTIPYATLLDEKSRMDPALHADIETAFNSSQTALGLLLVSDLPPEFAQMRTRALLAMNDFASLPEEVRDQYADAESLWTIGWNFGRQTFNGRREWNKGAYCANPNRDIPNVTPQEVIDNPVCSRSNVWPPKEVCPDLEPALKELSLFMYEVGSLLAGACDSFVSKVRTGKKETNKTVKQLVDESQGNKACMLHYFPPGGESHDISTPIPEVDPVGEEPDDRWCGIHTDHGCLTSLCPAMYLFHPTVPEGAAPLEPLIIPSPSSTAGLYIKTRNGSTLRAVIPNNCLGFQTGETLGLLSSEALQATTHFVHAGSATLSREVRLIIDEKKRSDPLWKDVTSGTVSRETLAVFLQPNVDEAVCAETGETFGEFSKRVQKRHY